LPELSRDEMAVDAWCAELDRLVEAGAAGFKIHSNVDGLEATHPAYRAMFEVANKRGLFVIVHTGCFHVMHYRRKGAVEPFEFVPLFEDFPDVRVCLAHMNRANPERAWEIMRAHENVYTDTSWQTVDSLHRAVDSVGVDRLLLGSDWPLLHDDLQGDCADILTRALSADQAEQVAGDNALRFLGEA
jgi:predicted TIM-barrel fold metal-dependent hydrolase